MWLMMKNWANPSLGGTTKNITPQNVETHSISKQHMIHIRKVFHFKFYIKRFLESYTIWNFNYIYKYLIWLFQMNGQGKCFKKVTLRVLLFRITKGTFFSFKKILLINIFKGMIRRVWRVITFMFTNL